MKKVFYLFFITIFVTTLTSCTAESEDTTQDKLVKKIIDSKLSLTKIKDLHRNHTLCCYKLKSESGINEGSNLGDINLAPKQ